jgi:hypothetical protein
MSSRFEQRRSRTGNAAPPIALVHPTGNESRENTDNSNQERPWQALVRKLRDLIAVENQPTDETPMNKSGERPVLRVLPGGLLDESEEQQRKKALARGKWH